MAKTDSQLKDLAQEGLENLTRAKSYQIGPRSLTRMGATEAIRLRSWFLFRTDSQRDEAAGLDVVEFNNP